MSRDNLEKKEVFVLQSCLIQDIRQDFIIKQTEDRIHQVIKILTNPIFKNRNPVSKSDATTILTSKTSEICKRIKRN